MKRVLIFYVTAGTGHQIAANNIREALLRIHHDLEVKVVDSLSYTNPILAKFLMRTYLGMIKNTPDIWDYLYDNPKIKKRTAKIRDAIHRTNSLKLETLLDEFRPHAIVCTQAFACGVISEYKRVTGRTLPLAGVVTDFAAHCYWAHDHADLYAVPTAAVKNTLVNLGIAPRRVRITGIPVHPVFAESVNLDAVHKRYGFREDTAKILIMGGSHGIGPVKEIITQIDRIPQPLEIIVVAGKNEPLQERLEARRRKMTHPFHVFGFVDNVHELMETADVLISKPGGVTVSEALIKRVPLVICRPIPGQETKNTEYLLEQRVAVKAEDPQDVPALVEQLLSSPATLERMARNIEQLRHPYAAVDIARGVLDMIE
jgi:processive 1,2-diacylglycerol beta-glucosyltransferase